MICKPSEQFPVPTQITVRFDWQMHDITNFICMMSPDAGGTDQVTQNRGYVAIPEVGDQVMVGFVHNHPDRPFVMGGMFHGERLWEDLQTTA